MKQIWLVKIKGEVKGPFNQEELLAMAEKGQLSAQDEVSKPLKRWIYAKALKKPELFPEKKQNQEKTISHSIKKRLLMLKNRKSRNKKKEENPQTPNSPNDENQPPNDQTVGVQDGAESSSDNTDEVYYQPLETVQDKSSVDFHSKQSLKFADEIDYVADNYTTPVKQKSQFKPLKHIESQYKVQLKNFYQVFWKGVLVLLIIGVFGFLFLQNQTHLWTDSPAAPVNHQQTLNQARTFFKSGQYQKALHLMKPLSAESSVLQSLDWLNQFNEQAPQEKPQKPSILNSQDWLNLSLLTLKLENRIYEARTFLERAQESPDFNKNQGLLLEGIIDFKEGNFSRANDFFNQAQAVMFDPSLAFIYQFILNINEGRFKAAQENLNLFHSKNFHKRFFSFFNFTFQYLSPSQDSLSAETDTPLLQFIEEGKEFSQEASFILLQNQFAQNSSQDLTYFIQKFLDQDPYVTAEHRLGIFFPSSQMIWQKLLMNSCTSIHTRLNQQAYPLALYAFCQTQAGSSAQAKISIEKARALYPSDPLILGVYSYILHKNQMYDQSNLYIEQALNNNQDQKFALPFILQARFCQQKGNSECSQKYWSFVQKIRSPAMAESSPLP